MRRSFAPLALAILAGCAADTASPPVADHFELVQGGAQAGIAGRALDSLVVVRLLDDRGAPIPGVAVSWSVDPGAGSVAPATAETGPDGTVAAAWTLGLATDTPALTVSGADVPSLRVNASVMAFTAEQIAVGLNYACAIDAGGDAWCWGEMGYGDFHSFGARPVKVDSGHALLQITAGVFAACGRSATATYCWGAPPDVGQGPVGGADYLPPAPVTGGHQFVQISSGEFSTCGIDGAGQAWCWGRDNYGNLGSTTVFHGIAQDPVAVEQGGLQFTRISASSGHTCALEGDGTAWCWGRNSDGELGDTLSNASRLSPARVMTDLRFRSVTAGFGRTCANSLAGETWCWGATPAYPGGPHPRLLAHSAFGAVSLGGVDGGVAIRTGRAYAWGFVFGYDLGAPQSGDPAIASELPGEATGLREIAFGGSTICGVRADGVVLCWGDVPGYDSPTNFGVAQTPVAIPAP